MSTRAGTGWSGWPVGEPPALTPLLVRCDEGAWSAGARAEFSYRDLGLAIASAGAISARHVRRVGRGTIGFDWHCHDADFQFNYVIAGATAVESEAGLHYRCSPGDAICEPALHRVREYDFSEDYECIQIAVPAAQAPPIVGRDTPLPGRAGALDPRRRTAYAGRRDGSCVRDRSAPVHRRDLGAATLTDGRLEIDVVAADAGRWTSGCAYLTHASWLCVLAGTAVIGAADGRPSATLGPHDAVGLGGGDDPRWREVTVGGPEYRALELRLG